MSSTNFHYFHPSDNVAPNATVTVQTGTEDANYPLANCTSLAYAKIAAPSRLSGFTGAWQFDFGSAQRVDAAVIWHNFDAGLAVSLQGHASASWGSPTLTTSLTVPAKRGDGHTVKIYKDLTGVAGYSTGGFRYWRLNVSGTNSAAIGVKVLFFSTIRNLSRNYKWGFQTFEKQVGLDLATDALVPWAYDYGVGLRQLSVDLVPSDADMLLLRSWFQSCQGRTKPTVIVPDPSTGDAWLVRWAHGGSGQQVYSLADSAVYSDYRTVACAWDEISCGDPEWY